MNIEIKEEKNNYLTLDVLNKDNNKQLMLPHGSGIDSDYNIEDKKDKYIIYNSYHYMNDVGIYMGWIDFKLIIPKNNPLAFKLTFQTNSTGYYWIDKLMLRQYLEDIYAHVFYDLS
jgi:hypothetical protein